MDFIETLLICSLRSHFTAFYIAGKAIHMSTHNIGMAADERRYLVNTV